eukprot:5714133-Pyramimonas_sp.AAC.1
MPVSGPVSCERRAATEKVSQGWGRRHRGARKITVLVQRHRIIRTIFFKRVPFASRPILPLSQESWPFNFG